MSGAAVFSSIDVALWLSEQATIDEVHLQPERLQRLLFLAQMIFAERNGGARLMPANFVVYNGMPIEVNAWRVFDVGHPVLGKARVKPAVLVFLDEIWQYHARAVLERIEQALKSNRAYAKIVAREDGSAITFAELREIAALEFRTHAVADEMKRASPTVAEEEQLPDGRVVQSWTPRAVSRNNVYKIETIKRKK